MTAKIWTQSKIYKLCWNSWLDMNLQTCGWRRTGFLMTFGCSTDITLLSPNYVYTYMSNSKILLLLFFTGLADTFSVLETSWPKCWIVQAELHLYWIEFWLWVNHIICVLISLYLFSWRYGRSIVVQTWSSEDTVAVFKCPKFYSNTICHLP